MAQFCPPLRGIELAQNTNMAIVLSPDARERAPLREGEDSMAKRHDKMGQPALVRTEYRD
jgi:hypothetical protein